MTIKIEGMSCAHCTGAVKDALEELGLTDVAVSLEEGSATYKEDDSVTLDQIKEAVVEAGYTVT